ncbi:hypothetical protein ACHAW6_015286 [Cyclotella cf. meneghiniana]
MDRPWNATELCIIITYINYYQDMWPSHAHILNPLTDHSGLKKHVPIPWTLDMQTAFKKMSVLIAADALAAYPDHNIWFDVYTDALDYQLVAYFSRKLTKSQQYNLVTEKDMLSIIPSLYEFQSILLCLSIHSSLIIKT